MLIGGILNVIHEGGESMDSKDIESRILGLSYIIGNTPLLSIDFTFKGEKKRIYAKAEHFNMTGSIKDRMAFHIIKQAYKKGMLKPGDVIVEATSGNTGISFAAIGRALGHPVVLFMPDWMSRERISLIPAFGAKITLVSSDEGGFLGCIKMAKEFAKQNGVAFLPNQFSNRDNVEAHYLTTGPEIWWQLDSQSLKPDAFVAGVGTGGTIMGVGQYIREKNPDIKLHPLEPANSPTLSTGYKLGSHRIQGICDEFIPDILKLDMLDEVISVDDGDAIIMSQKLACELGLGVGISSGANFLGALIAQNKLGDDSIVVTVFPDDNKKYLSTDLLNGEPVKEGFLSTDIVLKGFCTHNRSCRTCFYPKEYVETVHSQSDEKIGLSN